MRFVIQILFLLILATASIRALGPIDRWAGYASAARLEPARNAQPR